MKRRRRIPGADRGPRPVAESLDAVVRGLGEGGAGRDPAAPTSAVWGAVFTRWEDVVGSSIARHARPLRLDGAVLVVAVDEPAWATQVRALAPAIVAAVAERTGETLEALRVVVRS